MPMCEVFFERFLVRTALIIGLLVLVSTPVVAQSSGAGAEIGLQAQAYPAGLIGTVQVRLPANGAQHWVLAGGFNTTDRRDWGEHDDEQGGGAGVGVGWFLDLGGDESTGLYLGARADVWWLGIDWMQNDGRAGSTDITVLQPTARAGYRFSNNATPWVFDLHLSLGAEINIQTEGEAVGEGAILLGGVGVGYRL